MLRRNKRSSTSILAILTCVLGLTQGADAQHADFVLFGEADAEAAAVPAEQQFVHPVTAPYHHENSFVTSDVRPVYIYHDFPSSTLGGDAHVIAAQVRLALTDRIQFVAYKDGYTFFNDGVVNDEGFMDIAAGVKWNFYRDLENQFHMAAGIGYELGLGDSAILQDDDELRLWFSADKGFGKLHVGGTFNYFMPAGTADAFGSAERISWHVHADYYLTEKISPIIEFNGYHTIDASNAPLVGFTGVDVANLGGGEQQDTITMGLGAAFRIDADWAIRAAYELPLTNDLDLFGDRVTLSAVYSF